jgi:hypothetical protein
MADSPVVIDSSANANSANGMPEFSTPIKRDRLPVAAELRHQPLPPQQRQQERCGDGDPHRGRGQRAELHDGHPHEEERRAPDGGQQTKSTSTANGMGSQFAGKGRPLPAAR